MINGYDGQPLTKLAMQLSPHVFVRPSELRHAEERDQLWWGTVDHPGSEDEDARITACRCLPRSSPSRWSGGLTKNNSQMLNFVVCVMTAVAFAAALPHGIARRFRDFLRMGRSLRPLPTPHRLAPLEVLQRAVGDEPERSPVGLAGTHMLSKAVGAAPVSMRVS